MASKILFEDKQQAQVSPLTANKKLSNDDVNEIKNVVNSHADDIDLLSPIDVSFTEYTANSPTINPTNSINNYLLTRSGNGLLTFDITGVTDGNFGFVKLTNTIVGETLLGFANPSLFRVSGISLKEAADFTASAVTITNAVSNGGTIRITAAAHGYVTGKRLEISGITGTVEANGRFTITVIDPNTFDLNGSVFVNAYVSGGSSIALRDYLALPAGIDSEAIYSYVVQDGKIIITGTDDLFQPS